MVKSKDDEIFALVEPNPREAKQRPAIQIEGTLPAGSEIRLTGPGRENELVTESTLDLGVKMRLGNRSGPVLNVGKSADFVPDQVERCVDLDTVFYLHDDPLIGVMKPVQSVPSR